MTKPTISANTLEAGDATRPTLILLHGLGMSAWMWRPQLAVLGAHYHTITPNLPGVGVPTDEPFTLERAAQFVVELAQTQIGPAHICGLSLGAMVALQVYQTAPELVASLVLSGGQFHPNRLLMGVQQALMSLIPEREFNDDVPKQFRQRYPECVAAAQAMPRQIDKRSIMTVVRTMAAVDFRHLLPTVAVPTLVVCGAKDTPNLSASRHMARAIPHATLKIIPHVGHVWNLEEPDLFAQTVLTFVQRVDARTGRADEPLRLA